MNVIQIFTQIVVAGASLLYLLWMLHLTYPKAYHWLEDRAIAAWEWLILADHDPTWEARWEQMWGKG